MIATPAAATAIRTALGITDPNTRIDITQSNWDAYWCDITGTPAVAEIEWVHTDNGVTSTMVAADQAADQLNHLDNTDQCTEILVVNVSYWWAHYTTNPNHERIAA